MRDRIILSAILGIALWASPAAAEGEQKVPDLDIEKTCASSGRVQAGLSQQDSQDGCLRSERAAHDELKKRWSEFTPAAKNQCSKQATAGGFPSYVETVTCLELATGAAPAQTGGGANDSPGGPGAKESKTGSAKGSELTAEPSPRQRTNPIDVLEKKP